MVDRKVRLPLDCVACGLLCLADGVLFSALASLLVAPLMSLVLTIGTDGKSSLAIGIGSNDVDRGDILVFKPDD